jgi:thiamine-phosphate pyrophosphorylase
MKCDKKTMLLYAVTDRAWVGEQTLCQQVESALKGGVTCVQLREKELGEADFLAEAIEMKKLCKKYGAVFIVNDNLEVAIKSNADGIHVGQQDMNAKDVRRLIGDDKILGVSVHTIDQALTAEKTGADYLGVGSVFTTTTKSDAAVVSYETLALICKAVSVPVVAIGGINKDNILRLSGSGVDGVAVVSAIFSARDIEKECRELRILSEKMIKL